jgi:hypothetical protein
MRERERGERQESSILLTPLLAQSFSWKSDRTRSLFLLCLSVSLFFSFRVSAFHTLFKDIGM